MVGETLSRIIITVMTPADVREVLAIEKASFTTPWSEILFMNEIYKPGSMPLVARINGRIVGYICANQVLDEGHILNVTVHPEYRRQHIASDMIRHMIGLFRLNNCSVIFLEVRASNRAAIGMYELAGFRVIGVRKRYYTLPDEDAVNMAFYLPGEPGP